MIYLGYDDAMKFLKMAIALKGEDHVYPGRQEETCKNYDDNGEPACIVGHVWAFLGLVSATSDLTFQEAQYAGMENFCYYVNHTEKLVTLSRTAASLLLSVQRLQDQRNTWGQSLEIALRFITAGDVKRERQALANGLLHNIPLDNVFENL